MKNINIIPAIDLIEGQCVRLEQGDYSKKTVYGTPVDIAKQFEDLGIKQLHLVDLDGAKERKPCNLKVLEEIASATRLQIDFGGGIREQEDVLSVFSAGAKQINIGSLAVKNPQRFAKWISIYGAENFILGADLKNKRLATEGWQKTSEKNVDQFFAFYLNLGIRDVVCTDISKDGMLSGPSLALYSELLQKFPHMNLIASGGVSKDEDLNALMQIGIQSVIVGKAIYEKKISINRLNKIDYA